MKDERNRRKETWREKKTSKGNRKRVEEKEGEKRRKIRGRGKRIWLEEGRDGYKI